jgi:hypothetical protein
MTSSEFKFPGTSSAMSATLVKVYRRRFRTWRWSRTFILRAEAANPGVALPSICPPARCEYSCQGFSSGSLSGNPPGNLLEPLFNV